MIVGFVTALLASFMLTMDYTVAGKMTSNPRESSTLKARSLLDGMDFGMIMRECNDTYPVSLEFLSSINETGSFPDETQEIPKCFIRCYYQYVGMMDTNGNLDTGLMTEYFTMDREPSLEDTIIAKIVESCADEIIDICPCGKAYLANRCVMENIITSLKNYSYVENNN